MINGNYYKQVFICLKYPVINLCFIKYCNNTDIFTFAIRVIKRNVTIDFLYLTIKNKTVGSKIYYYNFNPYLQLFNYERFKLFNIVLFTLKKQLPYKKITLHRQEIQ